ncbi:hypothetical protein BG015_006176 [Linnemannia schmuckeri]|uniref:Uncharacterized protein n=1 Tax=Linnemannia schmuckeri TaxID=64567 RepID=A0A9P5S3L1_9FUNG|nr:hypothetical protein BG015_006176 [Linnemannia schmuckeri]
MAGSSRGSGHDPLKRRNNVIHPSGAVMKSRHNWDGDEDDDGDDDDEWYDESGNHGHGHHADHQGTNGRQGTMDGTHDESGTFTGTYTVTIVPGAAATNPAGQPRMTGRPSAASVINTRCGAGFALVSLILAIYFL